MWQEKAKSSLHFLRPEGPSDVFPHLLCSLPFPTLGAGKRFSMSVSFESCPAGLAVSW